MHAVVNNVYTLCILLATNCEMKSVNKVRHLSRMPKFSPMLEYLVNGAKRMRYYSVISTVMRCVTSDNNRTTYFLTVEFRFSKASVEDFTSVSFPVH